MTDDVVIVDYECMSAAGRSASETWETLAANRSGLRPIDRYNPASQELQGVSSISYAGQIPLSFSELAGSDAKFQKWCEPGFHAVQAVTRSVVERLGFDISRHDPQRIAFLGATVLTSHYSRDALAASRKADPKFILNQSQNIPLSAAASQYGIQGPCFSVSSGCASSAHAVYLASQFIRAGMIDAAFVVGYEFPILPQCVGGLDWLSALYRRDQPSDRAYHDPAAASRPLARDRRGFVLAEGVGVVFLCRASYASRSVWTCRATIRGGYSNSDADHLTRMSVDNARLCIARALEVAGCDPQDVDCINAHSTSTPVGDERELTALHGVFGDRLRQIPVVANKSQLGHSLGASAMLALILTVKSMEEGVVLPTLNHIPDPELPAALIPDRSMERRHDVTLVNAFGFGGTNVSLVVERGAT